MKKVLATVALAAGLSTPQAYAHGNGGDIAAGIIGGIIIGGILQQHTPPQYPPYYPTPPVVGYPPPPVVIQSPCYWTQEPLYDAWGRVITYRQVRVCRTY